MTLTWCEVPIFNIVCGGFVIIAICILAALILMGFGLFVALRLLRKD